ncbi:hypothetical protein AAFC00_005605 [Neodothiora populina]
MPDSVGQYSAADVHSQSRYDGPAYTSTPPPPPPKPASGRNSAMGTPLRNVPPPPPPPPPGYEPNPSAQSMARDRPAPDDYQISLPTPGWLPPFVQDLSTQDLRTLIEDPSLQASLLNNPETTHPSIPASRAPLQQALEGNIALASSLQQLESNLTHQRAAVQSRLLALRALEQQHRSKIAETEHALRNFSPMALYQRLNTSVQEQNALVRGIEESFLDESALASDRELSDFLRRLREAKRLSFLRSQRKERWDEGRVGGWR